MHEMALTRNVVDMVVEEASAAGASKVRTVYLEIGVARDIVEDMFEGMFAYMAKGTVAENAELIISRPPFMVRCNQCDHVYHIDVRNPDTWVCGTCGERDYQLESGMEFCINGIELVSDNDSAPQKCAG